ncbi:hypothetical protein P245_20810 [Comamonas thiooxydans]|uniref:Uncharacterized protein n=1 Tax=Comamonas thiooxydans TaxID=363952 RepID=A0A0E3BXL2_9BURK|nr:hypothetical protein [Comamonas thiooxydans]KGG86161.1 hypothetical protein P245_20810 [Comamonas thiooxydans]
MTHILQAMEVIQSAHTQEAQKRAGRSLEEWSKAELMAVWTAARDYAQQHGLRVPLMTEVESAEKLALGHSDYSRKLSLYVAERICS